MRVTFDRKVKHSSLDTAVTVRRCLATVTAGFIDCHKIRDVIIQCALTWSVSSVDLATLQRIRKSSSVFIFIKKDYLTIVHFTVVPSDLAFK